MYQARDAWPSPATSPSVASERTIGGQYASPAASNATANELPVRTACNYCRGKKVKCDKVAAEEGGCSRCRKEGRACCYETREPIGRPKKRRNLDDPGERGSSSTAGLDQLPRQSLDTLAHQSHSSRTTKHWPTSALPRAISPSSTRSISSVPSTSLGMTPSTSRSSISVVNPAHLSSNGVDGGPTLTDLGLAVFLESLDTLEINPEDGLTPNMLASLSGQTASSTAFPSGDLQKADQQRAMTSLSLANMQGSTSYAVPADFSWADSSWIDRHTSLHSFAEPASQALPRSTYSAAGQEVWPRGEEAGMGQAELRTLDGTLLRPAPSCCSSKSEKATRYSPKYPSGICPKTGKPGCCCVKDEDDQVVDVPDNSNLRVHCVPDPTGRGCTCLCDVSVALINVRTTLRRQAQDEERVDQSTAQGNAKKAASTLQLTLSASQAVAAQCACSASCPTCRTDPSTSLSASLLVSTALQIYVRAVRTLRQGFGATNDDPTTGASDEAGEKALRHSHPSGSEWDVSIGNYKPKARNAKRIALFAMKLELRDLRDAISKVSRAANASTCLELENERSTEDASRPASASTLFDGGINPIDQVVIRKLHQQLGDLLRTVETIEEQQDAERLAQAVGEESN